MVVAETANAKVGLDAETEHQFYMRPRYNQPRLSSLGLAGIILEGVCCEVKLQDNSLCSLRYDRVRVESSVCVQPGQTRQLSQRSFIAASTARASDL